MRRILFVDDEPCILDGLRRLLHRERGEWELLSAASGSAALEEMARGPVDVVLTDMRMPGMDGAALLEQVAQRYPDTIRLVLSGQTDTAAASRAILVAHQFLTKPCAAMEIRTVIDRACALRDLLRSPGLRRIVGGMESLPSAPTVWIALRRALGDEGASVSQISVIIEQDAGLGAKVLQLVNSSFFGQAREISSIAHATTLLGTGTIRALALAEQFFGSGLSPGRGCSLEEERNHALAVARLARHILPGQPAGEAAFTAGLLHDVGKLILAARLPQPFLDDLGEARLRGLPLHRVELSRTNVCHAEVGAYLLGLWGLPHEVVEAVAHHHAPDRVAGGDRRALVAVHVADALVHGISDGPGAIDQRLDSVSVAELGWTGQLPEWQEWASAQQEVDS
ncbi:MAG: response regulator [Gemmatimonadales bacterium]